MLDHIKIVSKLNKNQLNENQRKCYDSEVWITSRPHKNNSPVILFKIKKERKECKLATKIQWLVLDPSQHTQLLIIINIIFKKLVASWIAISCNGPTKFPWITTGSNMEITKKGKMHCNKARQFGDVAKKQNPSQPSLIFWIFNFAFLRWVKVCNRI